MANETLGEIVKTHIELDVVNKSPTLVFTDAAGREWVHEEQTSNHGGYITVLVKKENSWFFKAPKPSQP